MFVESSALVFFGQAADEFPSSVWGYFYNGIICVTLLLLVVVTLYSALQLLRVLRESVAFDKKHGIASPQMNALMSKVISLVRSFMLTLARSHTSC